MTISQAFKNYVTLLKQSGVKSAEIDVRILLREVLKKDDTFIYTNPGCLLSNLERSKLQRYVKRRIAHEPIAYITGTKEFFGLNFLVNKNVLIPRPETEEMVEQAIGWLTNDRKRDLAIADIGTGAGNIAISIAKAMSHNKNVALYATDISAKALRVAKSNARMHNLPNVNFLLSDLFSNRLLPKKFDLIVANLPYVPEPDRLRAQKNREEVMYEPTKAIYAPENGSQTVKKFLQEAKNKLLDGGVVLIELDPRNAIYLKNYAKKIFSKDSIIRLKKDLAGRYRFLEVSPQPASSKEKFTA